jgi:hypothetical protein
MVTIERATLLGAAPEQVFPVFNTAEGRLALGAGYVSHVTVEGEGVGAITRIWTAGHIGSGCVVERTEHLDAERFELDLLMTDTGGHVPVADYRARVRLFRAGARGCIALMRTTFVPVDMDEPAALALIEQNYELLLANLHRLFPVRAAEAEDGP